MYANNIFENINFQFPLWSIFPGYSCPGPSGTCVIRWPNCSNSSLQTCSANFSSFRSETWSYCDSSANRTYLNSPSFRTWVVGWAIFSCLSIFRYLKVNSLFKFTDRDSCWVLCCSIPDFYPSAAVLRESACTSWGSCENVGFLQTWKSFTLSPRSSACAAGYPSCW